jgi:membrane protein implicated in regulation of membrane protease activity
MRSALWSAGRITGGVSAGFAGYRPAMGLVLLLIILALIVGGVGLLVEALWWLLIISLILFVIGALTGWRTRGRPPPA